MQPKIRCLAFGLAVGLSFLILVICLRFFASTTQIGSASKTRSTSSVENTGHALLEAGKSGVGQAREGVPTVGHDFGSIVARDQTLARILKIPIQSSVPVNILRVVAETPCCTSAKIVENPIPPGRDAEIEIRIRAGVHSGNKQFRFTALTDSATRPMIGVVARIKLLAEREVRRIVDPGFETTR